MQWTFRSVAEINEKPTFYLDFSQPITAAFLCDKKCFVLPSDASIKMLGSKFELFKKLFAAKNFFYTNCYIVYLYLFSNSLVELSFFSDFDVELLSITNVEKDDSWLDNDLDVDFDRDLEYDFE